jgi:hypothetical protein
VRSTHPKNPPKHKFITPINVIINVPCGGATRNPTTIPRIPVPKNIIIRILRRKGVTYFMDRLFMDWQYYNLMNIHTY